MISKVREKLEDLDYLIDEQKLSFDRIDNSTVLMEGSVIFVDGSRLEFTEFTIDLTNKYFMPDVDVSIPGEVFNF